MTKPAKPVDKLKLTELRATAPAALEDVSETAWREFQALRDAQEQQFLPTAPVSVGGAGATHKLPARPRASGIGLDEAMKLARRNNRVCPMPQQWAGLYTLLAKAALPGEPAPAVVDGRAWDAVPPLQKRLRLKEQLEWAEQRGCLSTVHAFLSALPEDAWLHL